MNKDWKAIVADLLDDHNIILYALTILAIMYPEQQGTIVGAIAGFWTGKVVK
jgi:hypothetical protein